ncbi:chloramphenicol acetyltransferase [Desulfovibrio inopinatus]|uniref:chloramphenicol acetyltransferase n=1 Tax=Desulfovibrio inopinatus TaxID=102109 RepID=UPI000402682E|nr:chloramphenicol acetyltransferase [Desulfovibrio inopinatus]
MKIIDMSTWERKSHFSFFSGIDLPHFSVCFDLDVTTARGFAKEHGVKIFSLMLFLASYAANQIPEMKTRIRDGQVVEHDCVHPAFTIMGKNNVFNFCRARFNRDSRIFFQEVDENTEINKQAEELILGDFGQDDEVYMTSLPWIKFTSVQHPALLNNNDSVPRLTWGRFTQDGNQWVTPFSFQVHHGLADGYHAGLFADILQTILNSPEEYVSGSNAEAEK